MNVANLSSTEKSQLAQAFLDLKNPAKAPSRIPAAQAAVTAAGGSPNRYDDYVWMHNTVGFGAHRGPAFGPWHREFLFQLEHDLQQVSGDPELALPYWDWTTARSSGDPGWPFTTDFMGGFGNAGPGSATGYVTTGPFSNPATWRISIRRSGDQDITLKRSRGIPSPTSLPDRADVLFNFGVGVPVGGTWPQVYDALPWNDTASGSVTATQVNASFRKSLERLLHDGVHGWVGDAWEFVGQNPGDGGHMSFPSVSVNDPVFWLHHCNVDRLWSIWQRKVPGSTYLPAGTGTANVGHNGADTMLSFAQQSWFDAPLHAHPDDVDDHQGLGYWYHSDIPEVTPDNLSVSFGPVPEALTTYMPATFSVRTCRPVQFRITNVTGANFSQPAGQGMIVVNEDHQSDIVTGRVYVAFQANGTVSAPQAGSVTIEASIIDDDGYDTPAPGGTYVVGTWTINLSATPVPRPRAAIGLVLDRSGSMSLSAGAAGSRYDMLKASLGVVRDIMRPIDGVGVVTFDDATVTLAPITEMGPAGTPATPGSGREALENAMSSADLVPRNFTGIGQGMIAGAATLDSERLSVATAYQRFALCVMTDGNENSAPMVSDASVTAAIAPYAGVVYAIGLGQAGGVSDAVLTSISKYMLITGDITAAERQFRLTKYFMQILAGITNTAIVVDPQGELLVGSEHRIPFVLSEHDVEVDVLALSPLAPLIEMSLVAPDGTVLDEASVGPTVEYHENVDDAFFRLTLPVLPGVPVSGEWTAVLRLPKDSLDRHADDREAWQDRIGQLSATGTLPYSLIVQSYTNLHLEVDVESALCLVGDDVKLAARLTAFDRPYVGRAQVVASVTDPFGNESRLVLVADSGGQFSGTFATTEEGVHSVRFLATGGRGRRGRFQREETRTVTAYRGEMPSGKGQPGDDQIKPGETPPRRRTMSRSVKPKDFGLNEQPIVEPDQHHDDVPEHEPELEPGQHEHDHDDMVFSMFKRTPDGDIVEVLAQDIERDTSGYDGEGRDPGHGPERLPIPAHVEHHGHGDDHEH